MSLHSVDAIEVFAIIIPTHKPHLSYLSHMNRFVYQWDKELPVSFFLPMTHPDTQAHTQLSREE